MAITTTNVMTGSMLDELRISIQGDIFEPGENGYDVARGAWNLNVDQYPAVIVMAKETADIEHAVRFAKRAGLWVAIQSTGHGNIRPADDCLLIVTSQMDGVRVDASVQTAWIEAGATWGRVLEETQPFGLAPLLGSSPGVGAIGYSLGGGLGWLARKYGLAADSVRAFELVTAEGLRLRASQTENSDLFWGLRGGGGGYAVVTGMEIQLYPVASIYGGSLIYPVEMAQEVFTRYSQWINTTPEELTTSIKIANFPQHPMVPEHMRGQSFVMVNGCYCGPVEQGQEYLAGWLDWGAHIQNTFRVMPFIEVGSISNDPVDPMPTFSSGAWLRELNHNSIDTIIRYAVSKNGSSPLVITEVRHISGAMARVKGGPDGIMPNAFGFRDAPLLMHMVAIAPTPEVHTLVGQFVSQFKADLEPTLAKGVYMNFLEGEESRRQAKNAYPEEIYKRLKELKTRYDPDNLFRSGFTITTGDQ